MENPGLNKRMSRWKISLTHGDWKTRSVVDDVHDLADWHELRVLVPDLGMSIMDAPHGNDTASRVCDGSFASRSATGSHDRLVVECIVRKGISGVFTRRQTACGNDGAGENPMQNPMDWLYPLNQSKRPGTWTRRRLASPSQEVTNWMDDVYLFLLLATRMDMGKCRLNKGRLDGSQLFEYLCAASLKGFFGPRCLTKAVGAREIVEHDPDRQSRATSFHTRLTDLSEWLNEDTDEVNCSVLDRANCDKLQKAGDGGIDVVARLRFQDRPVRDAVYFFAQCKTGTSYTRQDAADLIPERFVVKFFTKWQIMLPSSIGRIFMIADHPDEKPCDELKWCGCIVFDRCRVLEALTRSGIEAADGISGKGKLLTDLREWNHCVLEELRTIATKKRVKR